MKAWIIGNGPSLTGKDLDLLRGEVAFATNRIFRIYDSCSWRPTYYVRLESSHANRKSEVGDIEQIRHPCTMYLHAGFRKYLAKTPPHLDTTIEFFHTCQHGYPYETEFRESNWHLKAGIHSICNLGNSVTAAMQIAVVLGYDSLYLLGCDGGYIQGGESHFAAGYSEGYSLRPAEGVNRDNLAAHRIAARCSPVPIYNATRGGELEMYPRVRLEDVLYL